MTTKKSILRTIFALTIFGMASCGADNAPPSTTLNFEHRLTEKHLSSDTSRNDKTADVRLSFPVLTNGNAALRDSILHFAENFAIEQLSDGAPETEGLTVETAISQFFNRFVQTYQDSEAGFFKSWAVEMHDTILGVSPQAVAVRLHAEAVTEGSQDGQQIVIANFDPNTGKRVSPLDFVTDPTGLQFLCEKKYRQIEAEAFQQGFQIEEFKLPENIGITPKGLIFHYNMYEVGNRSVGDTEFLIPFSELKPYFSFDGKKEKPSAMP